MPDACKIAAAGLKPNAEALLDVLRNDPFQNPPPFEKLIGDVDGAASRRINIPRRLAHEVFKAERTVRVLRMGALRMTDDPPAAASGRATGGGAGATAASTRI